MGPQAATVTTLLIAAGGILAVAAVVLLRLGRWPARTGDAPHCRGCGYLLQGNQSGRCPECGRELTAKNTVRGERRRRPRLEAVGWVSGVLAVLCLVAAGSERVRGIDWYRYRSASWVVRDAGSSDAERSARAWQELSRRRNAKKLPGEADRGWLAVAVADVESPHRARAQRAWDELESRRAANQLPADVDQALADAALREQAKPRESGGPFRRELIDLLARQYLAGKLTPEQGERFLRQALRLELKVRPIVAAGDQVPYSVYMLGDSPSDTFTGSRPTWWHEVRHLGVWVDGRQVGQGGSSSSGTGLGGGSSTGSWAPAAAIGAHTLEVRYRVQISHGETADGSKKVLHQREEALKLPFQVDDRPAAEHVKLLDRPELAPAMAAAIKVDPVRLPPEAGPDQYVDMHVTLDNVPEDVAFDVIAREGDKQYEVGTVSLQKGKSMGFGMDGRALRGVKADQLDFVFRSSDKAARRTVDLYQIWKGEVVVPGVKVERKAKK